jgi:hypothetical protein
MKNLEKTAPKRFDNRFAEQTSLAPRGGKGAAIQRRKILQQRLIIGVY